MKKILIAILALAAMPLAAQEYGQNRTVKIWDNASAPHSNGITTAEVEQSPMIIGGTSEAVLYIFEADPAVATGQAMVICPGGGMPSYVWVTRVSTWPAGSHPRA